MTTELLLAHRSADTAVAMRAGVPISAGRLLFEAAALARRLPPSRYLLNTCRDRYFFAVGLCAALISGRTTLLPPSRTPEALIQLVGRYPDTVFVGDDDGRIGWRGVSALSNTLLDATEGSLWPPAEIRRDHVAAIAFTSGSTGEPQPQLKTWGGIVDGAGAEVAALHLDDGPIEDVVLVGTVSPQHMFGLESTILLALHGPCAFATEHPLHADEVIAALSKVDGKRVLVTTPVHLRALSEAPHPMPTLYGVVSATAPLASSLAARCESTWNTRVHEVYGCTETGMIATRRTVDGPLWTAMRDVKVERRGDDFYVSGGHVHAGRITDRLRIVDDTTFELGRRGDDMVNIGGKRASLEGLNRILLSIEGVIDGVIFLPADEADANREQRLAALVVAPDCTVAQLMTALRAQVDAAFLPRPLLLVDALPRNAQGKLPKSELMALMKGAGAKPCAGQPNVLDAVARRGARIE